MSISTDWHRQAIRFLQRRADAMCDIIEHFVEISWNSGESPEENLRRFELYRAEFVRAYLI